MNENEEEVLDKTMYKKTKDNEKRFSGYNFTDIYGDHDVPIIKEPMWYRLIVRKASERKLTELFASQMNSNTKWKTIIYDAYYPTVDMFKLSQKQITASTRPLVPGIIYIKTRMHPDIAAEIEEVKGVYGFARTAHSILLPLNRMEVQDLENTILKGKPKIDPEILKIRKDEYVGVVDGPHKGKYGILMGTKNGFFEVCLRGDYKDDWDLFEPQHLRYLDQPPEKKWDTLTAKEAVENLLSKDPHNPMIKSLKKQGLLSQILYEDVIPKRSSMSMSSDMKLSREDRKGREGGASVRSIANSKGREKKSPTVSSTAPTNINQNDDREMKSFLQNFQDVKFDDNLLMMGDSRGPVVPTGERHGKGSQNMKKSYTKKEEEDVDDFIAKLLSEADEAANVTGDTLDLSFLSAPSQRREDTVEDSSLGSNRSPFEWEEGNDLDDLLRELDHVSTAKGSIPSKPVNPWNQREVSNSLSSSMKTTNYKKTAEKTEKKSEIKEIRPNKIDNVDDFFLDLDENPIDMTGQGVGQTLDMEEIGGLNSVESNSKPYGRTSQSGMAGEVSSQKGRRQNGKVMEGTSGSKSNSQMKQTFERGLDDGMVNELLPSVSTQYTETLESLLNSMKSDDDDANLFDDIIIDLEEMNDWDAPSTSKPLRPLSNPMEAKADTRLAMNQFDRFEEYLDALVEKAGSKSMDEVVNESSNISPKPLIPTETAAAPATTVVVDSAPSKPNVSSLTVTKLKDILKANKLPVSGTKAQLIERIVHNDIKVDDNDV